MLEPTFTGKLDFLLLYGGLIWPLFFVLVRFGGWPSTHAINSRTLRVAGLLLAGVLISGALTGWDPGRWGLSRGWLALLLWAQAIGHTGILVWACGWAPRPGEASGKGPPSRSRDAGWLLFLFAALVVCGFTTTELQTRKRDALLRAELLTRALLGAVAISTEGLAALPGTESDTQLPEYQRLKRKLTELHEAIPHNRFTYLCRQRGKDVIILADSEPPTSKDYSPPGQVYAEASDGLKRSLSEHMQAIENYQDRWGEWVSGFVPLNLPNHLASVSFGLDEEATYWRDQIALERRVPLIATTLVVFLFLSLFIAYQKLKDSLARAQDHAAEAQQANRAKSDFLATMSHEIRTPMNGILGMTEMLQQSRLNAQQRELANIISHSGKALLGIINDILDLAKIEAGQMVLVEEDFEVRPLLEAIVTLFAQSGHGKPVSVRAECDPAVPVRLRGDAGRLRQILLNLVSNGLKFTAAGSVVAHIRLGEKVSDRVRLRFAVTDTGVGIPKAKQTQLFQPFQQLDSSTTRRHGGTGLGLVISRRLVELLGGTRGVTSDEGKGSTFWFEIPLTVVAESVRTEVAATPTAPRVLVARNHNLNSRLSLLALEKLGCRGEAVGSGQEVLTRLEEQPYEAVLFDLQLSDMEGGALVAAIRQREKAGGLAASRPLRLIGLADEEISPDRERLLTNGLDALLRNPPALGQLKQALTVSV